MPITTPVTQLLGIAHPILNAPMDLVADGRLVAAVAAAGGFGVIGGGYGNENCPASQLELLQASKSLFLAIARRASGTPNNSGRRNSEVSGTQSHRQKLTEPYCLGTPFGRRNAQKTYLGKYRRIDEKLKELFPVVGTPAIWEKRRRKGGIK